MFTSTKTIYNNLHTCFPPGTVFKLEAAVTGYFRLVSNTPGLTGSRGVSGDMLHEWLTDGTLLAGG